MKALNATVTRWEEDGCPPVVEIQFPLADATTATLTEKTVMFEGGDGLTEVPPERWTRGLCLGDGDQCLFDHFDTVGGRDASSPPRLSPPRRRAESSESRP